MVDLKTRGEHVRVGEIIELKALFTNSAGIPITLSELPHVQIIQPNTAVYRPFSSNGVYRFGYSYALQVQIPLAYRLGVSSDIWIGQDGYGNIVRGSFNFIVVNTDIPSNPIDGYAHLGDLPSTNLSQTAIININRLMDILRKRLQSSGMRYTTDSDGNPVYEPCDIFTVEEMYSFLCSALSEFNSTPHFTSFTFEDQVVLDFFDVIVEGACIMALASKALIEKGREFTLNDNGLTFQPPAVADLLNSQFSAMLGAYREKLKNIKYSMKSKPLGLGTLRIEAVSPLLLRLRHRRAGQWNV